MAPSTQIAAVINETGNVDVKKVAVPKAGDKEVLVNVVAAALNPADWKIMNGLGKTGSVPGHDFAGVIAELGPAAESTGLKVGDRVTSYVPWARGLSGSFAEYVAATAELCIPLPDSWTFEQGAQVGVGMYTAFQALYESINLPEAFSEGTPTSIPLLVYGASSAVGIYAVQIAKATGFKVFAVCSPKNFDLVKSLGAEATFDYKDSAVSQKIKDASGGKIQYAFDAISEHGSAKIIAGALSSEGGKIATLGVYNETDKAALGPHVTHQFSNAYALFSDSHSPKYSKIAKRLLAEGKVKPSPVRVWENGLAGINEAKQYMIDGKVSGEKLVFRISDTPSVV
ncbi:dehydrogenase [Peniophora sp. CONT]|nr:dehydrogenase [Peniophora sp. CONT]